MRLIAAPVLLLLAACVPQYDPCLAPDQRVSDARILAVAVDPPEVILEPATDAPPMRLRVLAGGGLLTTVTGAVRLCAVIPDTGAGSIDAACEDGPPLQWDGATTLSADVRPSRALLAEALRVDPLNGYQGLRVTAEIEVLWGTQRLFARKLLLYREPGTLLNTAPKLAGLDLVGLEASPGDYHPGRTATWSDGNPAVLGVSETVGLTPILAEPPEEYDVIDLAGKHAAVRETIEYTFYASPHLLFGDVQRVGNNPVEMFLPEANLAIEPEPGSPRPRGLVRLTGFKLAGAEIWLVARDGRGAVSFMHLPVTMKEIRICINPVTGEVDPKYCPSLESGVCP